MLDYREYQALFDNDEVMEALIIEYLSHKKRQRENAAEKPRQPSSAMEFHELGKGWPHYKHYSLPELKTGYAE